MRFTPSSAEAWKRANLEEEDASFNPWDPDQPYVTSSMPALKATKCVQLQGEQAFQCFHMALFKAFFKENQNISDRYVLISLVQETGLDVEKFNSDFDQDSRESEVMEEYEGGRASCQDWGIPLAIIGEHYPLGGAVPIEMYRRGVDLCFDNQAD